MDDQVLHSSKCSSWNIINNLKVLFMLTLQICKDFTAKNNLNHNLKVDNFIITIKGFLLTKKV